jgi:VanZ like family
VKRTNRLLVPKFFFGLAVLWTIAIIVLCLQDNPRVPNINFLFKDKVLHFGSYFVFIFLWFSAIINQKYFKIVIVFGIALGIVLEILQHLCTNNRTFDWFDILANALGVTTGFYAYKFLLLPKIKKIVS